MNSFKIKSRPTKHQENPSHKKWMWLILVLPLIIFFLFKKGNEAFNSSNQKQPAFSQTHTNPDLWNKNGPFDGFSPQAELINHRDKNAKHFPNEDGTMTALISAGSVHYEETDGSWQEIDPKLTISSRAGFSYENTTNGIKSWFPDGNGKKAVLMEVKGQQLSLAEKMELSWVDGTGKVLLSQSAKYRDPEVKGNTLVYPSFFPGIKNEFEIGFDQIKNKVILDEKPDSRGDYLILKEQLRLPKGWQVQVQGELLTGEKIIEGGFELVDEEGSIQLYIPAPEVFDQNENSRFQNKVPARWILEQKGLQLDLKMQVDQNWLQDPGREYPVILDPSMDLTANRAGNLNWYGYSKQVLNKRTEVSLGAMSGGISLGWMQFNTGSIPEFSSISSVESKIPFNNKNKRSDFIYINDITGPYGDYTDDQFDPVSEDLYNGRYTKISVLEDPTNFWHLGNNAVQDLKDRLSINKFQIGMSHYSAKFYEDNKAYFYNINRNNTVLRVVYCFPFVITEHPNDVSTCIKGDANFSIAMLGNNESTQQWAFSKDEGITWINLDNGGKIPEISGANSSTLNLSNIPISWNTFHFRVTVTNECELTQDVISQSARLLLGTPPVIVRHPKAVSICEGDRAVFRSNIDNATSLQWQESQDGGNNWTDMTNSLNVSGVNINILTLWNVPASLSGRQYRLSGTNCETVYSSGALLTIDNTPPVALCKDLDIPIDAEGNGSVTAMELASESTDNCGSLHFEFPDGETEAPVFCYSGVGSISYKVKVIVKDNNGNQSDCISTIRPVDNIPPTAKCRDLTLKLNSNGQAFYTKYSVDDGSFDNCGLRFGHVTPITLTCSDIGSFEFTNFVMDIMGNTSSCTSTITVEDNKPPIPDLTSLPTVSGDCSIPVTDTPTATDNCSGSISGTTDDPLTYSEPGTYSITWKYDDGNGNTTMQTQTVIIDDVTAPVPDVATLPTITASCEAGIEPPFATDNCAGQIIGTTSDPLYFDKEGTYTVTWIYDDGNGNTSSQDQTIVIKNDVEPVPDRQTLPSLRAQCGLTVSQTPTATDQCGGTIVATTSDPLTYHTQGTYLITWTFNNGNGNTSTQTQKVVIRDTKAPVPDRANLPALGGSCSLLITNFPTATDNCAGSVTATTNSPLEYDQEGTYAITWNYEDGNGNTSSQIQWVIISSDAEPTAECKNISVALGTNNQVNIKAEDIDKGSYDECGSVTLLISSAGSSVFSNSVPPAPSMDLYCKDGKVHNLMLSVTNEKGNTAYCQATVFLEGTDSDNDGILDQCDNCPDTYNSDQKDGNNNGTGDACEESTNPDPNPGGWGDWSLKKQDSDQENIITELRAYPNPFQEEVNLSFSLNQEERTTVEIFNIQGQKVHTLLSEIAPKGEHRVQWDGKDQNGQPMPDGIYLIRLRAGKALINQKVILQR